MARFLLALVLGTGPEIPEARAVYDEAIALWTTRTEEGLSKSLDLFEKAARIDPGFARAHAGIASASCLLALYGYRAPSAVMPRGRDAALQALRLDDSLAEAHASLGLVRYLYEWSFEEAERSFARAVALDPGYSSAHHWYAMMLMATRRFDESLVQIDRAIALEPGSPLYRAKRETIERAAGRLDEAETHSSLDDEEKAREKLASLEREESKRYVSPVDLALLYAELGEKDKALDALERAFEVRDAALVYLRSEPGFSSLRSEPRFRLLLEKMGL
jgi:tetratricopeptide (TPR) repeat protein